MAKTDYTLASMHWTAEQQKGLPPAPEDAITGKAMLSHRREARRAAQAKCEGSQQVRNDKGQFVRRSFKDALSERRRRK